MATFAIFRVFLLASEVIPTQAQKFKMLCTFHASDADAPGQLRDIAGNPYGSTIIGGNGQMPRRPWNGLQGAKPDKMI
jgi:hypothetical protein